MIAEELLFHRSVLGRKHCTLQHHEVYVVLPRPLRLHDVVATVRSFAVN
jgi:hypothetical protein